MKKIENLSDAIHDGSKGDAVRLQIEELIARWLEDGVFDDGELAEAILIEEQLRSVCEEAYNNGGGDLDKAIEQNSGLASIALSWFTLGGAVLSLSVKQGNTDLGEVGKAIADSKAFCDLFQAIGSNSNVALDDYVLPWTIVAIIWRSSEPTSNRWRAAIDDILESQPSFASAVTQGLAAAAKAQSKASLKPMSRFLQERESHTDRGHRKSFKEYQSRLSAEFKNQNFITFLGGFLDESQKEVMLTVGDEALAISYKNRDPVEVPKSSVKFISVGSRTERMHAGFSHRDFQFWTFDIQLNSSARWRLDKLIGGEGVDPNPMREFLTTWIGQISGDYRVVASGSHTVAESGYRTRVSYGIWT